jgi:PAS domain S-box-containing protein
MTGYTKEELIGKNPYLWMQKEYLDKIHEVVMKKLPFSGKIINKRKNGELYPVEVTITPILDEKGETKFHVGIERDISSEKILEDSYAKIEAKSMSLEQSQKALANVLEDGRTLEENLKKEKEGVEKKIEERTKELLVQNIALTQAKEEISKGWFQVQTEKARLLASVSSIPLGFIMFDNEGKLLLKNPAFEKTLGITSYYADIDSIDTLLGNDFAMKNNFTKSMKDKQPIDIKEVHFSGRYFHVFFAPVLSSDQSLTSQGVIILIQDITEAKILDRSKDEFFSIASHELRTPLTAIRGNTSLIKQYYGDKLVDKDLAEMIEDIHASSERLIEIVNDFLNVSRLEQGKMVYKKEAVSLVELTQSVIKEYQTTGSLKMLFLKFAPPAQEIPKVFADNDKTRQIIINLIGNSLKYTEKGGVTVSIETDESFVKLLVSDTGRGIEEDQQNLLFRKFQQTERSILTRDTTQGTGLGLYISKLMIEGMGGKIALEKSEPNIGSVFSFTLPIENNNVQNT